MPAAKLVKKHPELFLVPNRTLFNGRVASDHQEAVFKWVEDSAGNLVLVAVAGSGKSTTLVEMTRLMRGSVALLAYNRTIADELQAKLLEVSARSTVKANTFHSFGFSAIRKAGATNVKVNGKKVEGIMESMPVDPKFRPFVGQLVSLAKQRALGVHGQPKTTDTDAWLAIVDHFALEEKLGSEYSADELDILVMQGIAIAQDVLATSNAMWRDVIDFDDQIYIPLVANLFIYKNDWVLVDEAQDTNPARRELASRMLAPNGRIVFVGDPHQAIYGFTGADNDALDIITTKFGALTLPLTITYRCPKAVVAIAQQYVAHITAADSAPEGEVINIKAEDFHASPLFATLTSADVILCRNTKPLVETAFSLIRRGIGCHVEGRDIGNGLKQLALKWKNIKTVDALRTKLTEWVEKETKKLEAKKQDAKIDALNDRVETLFVIMDALPMDKRSVWDVTASIDSIFGDTRVGEKSKNITLSTVHKAKGREWDRVFLWGRTTYMPSWYAKQEWQKAQEVNLIYTAITRARAILVEVEVPAKSTKKRG